jgi:leader peptidase (prepilin peptidase)/N-methyltransferase
LLAIAVAVLVFISGTILGSFINAVTFRYCERSLWSIIFGRSKCDTCQHPLHWYDLIPILSFIISKRRCRYCNAKISWQYIIVEIIMGLISVGLFFKLGLSWAFLVSNFIFASLLAIFVIDFRKSIIPNVILWPLAVLTLLFVLTAAFFPKEFTEDLVCRFCTQPLIAHFAANTFSGPTSIFAINVVIYSLGGAAFAALFFGLQIVVSRGRWTGLGDLKLGTILGLLVGWPLAVLWLFFSYVLGGAVGLVLIMLGRKKIKDAIPFGPFLILGAFLTFFWGIPVWNWYLSLFL